MNHMNRWYHVAAGLVVAALLTSAPAPGQESAQEKTVDVSGVWEITSETPRGPLTRKVTFKQEGNSLTGTMQGPRASLPIQKGSIEGDKITFTLAMSRGDRSIEMTYTGTVAGDSAKGTLQTPRRGTVEWTAKRVGRSEDGARASSLRR